MNEDSLLGGLFLFVKSELIDAALTYFSSFIFDQTFGLVAENAGGEILSQNNAAVFKKDLNSDARADLKSVSHLDGKYYSSEFVDLSYDSCAFHSFLSLFLIECCVY